VRNRAVVALVATIAAGVVVGVFGGTPAGARPLHWTNTHRFAQPPTTADCETQFSNLLACYGPFQFEQAYNMNPLYSRGLTGRGETIAIVDSFGSPTIQADLAQFDSDFALPPPPSFQIIQPAGPVPPFDPTNSDMAGWAIETSLDVEYAHAMAPGANILLVETPVSETEGVQGFPQIAQAENYVINHHMAQVISQSFGATEQTFPNPFSVYALRGMYVNAAVHGVTVLSASGDAGATDYQSNQLDFYPFRVTSWPASDPLVTSVGGTQLTLDAAGNRTAPDVVWNDEENDPLLFAGAPAAGGGGQSIFFGRPAFQDSVAGVVGSARGVPDVSMSAAVNGGALVYMSFDGSAQGLSGPGYYIIGGTSEAAPEMAGVVAVADQAAHHPLGLLNPSLYRAAQRGSDGLTDITSGNNTATFTNSDSNTYTVTGFNAVPGFDLASGLGSPDGVAFVQAYAHPFHF